jgi:hypothetical protein
MKQTKGVDDMGFDLGGLITQAVNVGLTAELGPLAGPLVSQLVDPILQQMFSGQGGPGGSGGTGQMDPLSMLQQFMGLNQQSGGLQNAYGLASPSPYSGAIVRDHRGVGGSYPGGYPGGIGGGSPGGVNFGGSGYGPSGQYQQLQSNLQQAAQSGDPQKMYQAQQAMDQYNRCWEFMQQEEQAQQKMAEDAIKAISQSV